MIKTQIRKRPRLLGGILLLVGLLFTGATTQTLPILDRPGPVEATPHRVYIAFGFHTNLYHSYRVDTPDEAGFGMDIRVIRHIIKTLDEYEKTGRRVPAVWNFDNLFSLQSALPEHAPDIITDVRRRIESSGDEVIVMSYNNGLVSAMQEGEFRDNINRAITNEHGSGIQDLFGEYSPIVRPQEMMVTPGNYGLYKDMGIDTISLFYSSIAFDAFRVFERPLTREEAHNPLTYHDPNTGESMRVIPTYNIGDLAEHVSLRHWAEDLHRRQRSGEIKRDVLIYINTDADSPYWYGADLPAYLSWLPNTGGLRQVLDSVADLDFVEFTTLADYLEDHPPVATVSFAQDLADGSFNGYNSWSEKESSHRYWTALVRDRRNHDFTRGVFQRAGRPLPGNVRAWLDESYEKRLRLLSTTNFGLAMPFLARGREQHVEDTIRAMLNSSEVARAVAERYVRERAGGPRKGSLASFYLQPSRAGQSGRFVTAPVPRNAPNLAPGTRVRLKSGASRDSTPALFLGHEQRDDGVAWRLLLDRDPRGTAPALAPGRYEVHQSAPTPAANNPIQTRITAKSGRMENDRVALRWQDGRVTGVALDGRRMLLSDSFTPMIRYEGREIQPRLEASFLGGTAHMKTLRLHGAVDLPGQQRPGFVDYRISMVADEPFLLVRGSIQYPDTARDSILSPNEPALARRFDSGWQETAPLPIHFALPARDSNPFRVFKRNYLGLGTDYKVDYFRHDPANRTLANLNNHLTPEYAALGAPNGGLAVAADGTDLANFAFAPMKMRPGVKADELLMSVNPFGTYHGEQWTQPTWEDGLGNRLAESAGPQYVTAAPTYNGRAYSFSLMVALYNETAPTAALKQDLIAFARPPFAVALNDAANPRAEGPAIEPARLSGATNLLAPRGLLASADAHGAVHFDWEPETGASGYRVFIGENSESYIQTQTTRVPGLKATHFAGRTEFVPGQRYFATVVALDEAGREGERSREISFVIEPPEPERHDVPLHLMAGYMWKYIKAELAAR